MKKPSLTELKKFLAAWFHEDWSGEGTAAQVVAKFRAGATPAKLTKVQSQTATLLASSRTEDELAAFLNEEAGAAIHPPGLKKTHRAWFKWLEKELSKTK